MKKITDFPPGHFKGWSPKDVVEALEWRKLTDEELTTYCQQVINAHQDEVLKWRNGKRGLIGFFIAKVIDATCSCADPALTKQKLESLMEIGY